MKQYQLTKDFGGLPAGTSVWGPYSLQGSLKPAYFLKENIPPEGEFGSNGFFQSSVEGNNGLFKLVEETKIPDTTTGDVKTN